MKKVISFVALLAIALTLASSSSSPVSAIAITCTMRECPAVCQLNCSGQTPTPIAAAILMETFLSRSSTLCGNLPVEYPDYAEQQQLSDSGSRNFYASSAACPSAEVKRVMGSAVDISSIGVISVLASDGNDVDRANSYTHAIAAALDTSTTGNNPLRAAGREWKYRRDKVFPDQIGDGEGYMFPKVACKMADARKLNVSEAGLRPNLATTALVINGALVNFAARASSSNKKKDDDDDDDDWPVTEERALAAVEKFSSTLTALAFHETWLQETPDRTTEGVNTKFHASAASHALVLHVADYALNLSDAGIFTSVKFTTLSQLKKIRAGAAAVVERICNETAILAKTSKADEPLLDGVELRWSESESNPAKIPNIPVRARDSLGTSLFVAALGPENLGRHCSAMAGGGKEDDDGASMTTAQVGVKVAENLINRALLKYGLKQPAQESAFMTQGIVYKNGGEGSVSETFYSSLSSEEEDGGGMSSLSKLPNNCTVDVKQTAWLHIAVNEFSQLSPQLKKCADELRNSAPYRRTLCHGSNYLSSWQDGYPLCGAAVPSYALSAYMTAAWLIKPIFAAAPTKAPVTPVPPSRAPGAPTPVPSGPDSAATPAPGPNSHGEGGAGAGSGSANWQQPLIGVACAAVVMLVVFLGVRYLKKQTHHRTARLAGGDDALGGGTATGYGAASAGTFM